MIKDYRYINENYINVLIEQIPKKQPRTYKSTILTSIGFNPKVEIIEESLTRDFNDHEKVEIVINFLK